MLKASNDAVFYNIDQLLIVLTILLGLGCLSMVNGVTV